MSANRSSSFIHLVAALDVGRGRHVFSKIVANSDGASLDYPPTRAIDKGRFEPLPLGGTRWITACDERDLNPERGARFITVIEEAEGGPGALHRNPRNVGRLFELFKP